MKDNLGARLALALALGLPAVSFAQSGGVTTTYEVTGGRPRKASETGRSGQVSSWPSSVEDEDLKDAPAGKKDTATQDQGLKEPKSPRRWWQFWRWFETDQTVKDTDVR